jgi:hypothetical protein
LESFVRSEHTHTLHLREWEAMYPGLCAGFTLRTGGHSRPPFSSQNHGLHVGDDPAEVVANRRLLTKRLGFPFSSWTCGDQVHGTKICRVTADRRGAGREQLQEAIPAADGLHTDLSDVLLTSFYADCVPLYFLDPKSSAVGLAHAGWKGTVGKISSEMVKAFAREYGSDPSKLLVAIGPAIGGCCYQVDGRIVIQVQAATARWSAAVVPDKVEDRYLLDLPLLNELILEEAGVAKERILRTEWCTNCRKDLFFSHRGEAGKTGRMASFIGWRAEGDVS